MRFLSNTGQIFFPRLLGVICLVWTCGVLPAQTNTDSLWQVWQNEQQPDSLRLRALQKLTWTLLYSRPDSARQLAELQLRYARDKGLRLAEGKALYNIATHHYLKGEYAPALAFFRQSLDIRRELGDLAGEAAILGNFGVIYYDMGDRPRALEYYRQSLALNERLADTIGLATNYNGLARAYLDLGNTAAALEFFEKSRALHASQGDRDGVALIDNNIGNVYLRNRRYEQALEYFQKSLSARLETGDRVGEGINYLNIGETLGRMADYRRGEEYLRRSIRLFQELGEKNSLGNAYHSLGALEQRRGRYAAAAAWCRQSYEQARAIGDLQLQHHGCRCLYESYKALRRPQLAVHWFEQYSLLDDSLKRQETALQLGRLQLEKDLLTDSLARAEEKRTLETAYQRQLQQKNRITDALLAAGAGAVLLILLLWGRVLFFQKKAADLRLRSEQLEKQQLIGEVNLLRTQVNPHFLFNSLSILSSLARVNPDLSEQFIDQLARSYRYILEQREQALVTLRTELEFIRAYVFLLKIRFEDKFDVRINLPEQALDEYQIAPLTLQLLLENAVKHNRMSAKEPLVVEITLGAFDVLLVRNQLQPRPAPADSTGMGLQNIVNRYTLLTERPVWAGVRHGRFEVEVPLLPAGHTPETSA